MFDLDSCLINLALGLMEKTVSVITGVRRIGYVCLYNDVELSPLSEQDKKVG